MGIPAYTSRLRGPPSREWPSPSQDRQEWNSLPIAPVGQRRAHGAGVLGGLEAQPSAAGRGVVPAPELSG